MAFPPASDPNPQKDPFANSITNSAPASLQGVKLTPPSSAPSSSPSSARSESKVPNVSLTNSEKNNRKPESNELLNVLANRTNKWASEIIPNMLWLGSGTDASKLVELEKRKIQHVLNVADDVPNYHGHKITYLNLNVVDFGQDKGISRVFDDAFKFLKEAEEKKEPVLVHCAAGANRSAAIVIAWLMQSRQWTLLQSWEHVKTRRPGVVPLKDNRIQLLNFERTLFEKPSMGKDEFLDKK